MAVEVIKPGLYVRDGAVHRQQVAAVIVILADYAGLTVDRLKEIACDRRKRLQRRNLANDGLNILLNRHGVESQVFHHGFEPFGIVGADQLHN